MSNMPVPAEQHFKLFAFDLLNYSVQRDSKEIAIYEGLISESKKYVAFKMGCDIQVGDVLSSNNQQYIVQKIDYDYYNKQPDMLKAYY